MRCKRAISTALGVAAVAVGAGLVVPATSLASGSEIYQYGYVYYGCVPVNYCPLSGISVVYHYQYYKCNLKIRY